MPQVIQKYVLGNYGIHEVELPFDARILHVGIQDDKVCLWVMVELSGTIRTATKRFYIAPTGQELNNNFGTYIGTATYLSSVWHVFEVCPLVEQETIDRLVEELNQRRRKSHGTE